MNFSDQLTQHHLRRRLGWKPEDDESEEREENARQNEDVVVEDGDALEPDGERKIRIRFGAARVVFDVLDGRVTNQSPLVALHVVRCVDRTFVPIETDVQSITVICPRTELHAAFLQKGKRR